MFLLLSGEGPSDIGVKDDETGPMAKFVDHWIGRRSRYSLIESLQYKIVAKQRLVAEAKAMKARSKKGKKHKAETRYYYKNARAMALLARREECERGALVIAALFRDADGTASSDRGEWNDKWLSMLKGFEAEGIAAGVPMIPKPKSEAWALCALRNNYSNCGQLENESGNDASPNSLKKQLEEHLGEPGTRAVLNGKIDEGKMNIKQIVDMPSLTAFKDRLDEVLDNLNVQRV